MPVFKCTHTITVLLHAESLEAARAEMAEMDISLLVHEMTDGSYVGDVKVGETHPVPAEQVGPELEAMRSDPTFFDDFEEQEGDGEDGEG